ncbi:MAG: flagellar export chaperone FlgN [Phycisphaerales bacterium]|nr:flagellar export chaperone FlgN [Phycisphaerales bacterium]
MRTLTTKTKPLENKLDTDRLDSLLSDLSGEHETLLILAGEHRDAIAHADPNAIGRVIAQTGEVLERIATIERSRQKMITKPDGKCMTITEILPTLAPEPAERIEKSSAKLRSLIAQLRIEHRAVQDASTALAQHMQGLIKQVSANMSHAGTYGRNGSVDPVRTQVTSSMDIHQ